MDGRKEKNFENNNIIPLASGTLIDNAADKKKKKKNILARRVQRDYRFLLCYCVECNLLYVRTCSVK